MYTKIVVCIDGSAVASKALAHAIQLAKEQRAHLDIVHAMECPGINWPNLPPERELELLNLQRDQSETLLRHAADQARGAGIESTSTLLETGITQSCIAEALAAHAERISADLVILGSHGYRGVTRLFLGSVAARTAQLCKAPVLIIHDHQ